MLEKESFKGWGDGSSDDSSCYAGICKVYRVERSGHGPLDLPDYRCYHCSASVDSRSDPLLQLPFGSATTAALKKEKKAEEGVVLPGSEPLAVEK